MLKGLRKVVRFNWPYYASALGLAAVALLGAAQWESGPWPLVLRGFALVSLALMLLSLAATAWVYDYSPLYRLDWLERFPQARSVAIFTAGLDEISGVVRARLSEAKVEVFDVYPQEGRTEESIKRAREVGGSEGQRITAREIPLTSDSVDLAIVFMAAHEIREAGERIAFFSGVLRCLRAGGRVIVVEHERDLANALAYSIGVFHFLPVRSWQATFAGAGLVVRDRSKVTPLVSVYELERAA